VAALDGPQQVSTTGTKLSFFGACRLKRWRHDRLLRKIVLDEYLQFIELND